MTEEKRRVQARRWFLTINNYSDEEIDIIKNMETVYTCIGKEEAPTTGTKHIHVIMCFSKPKWKSTIKGKLPRARVEKMMAKTVEQAREYLIKECKGNPPYYESGEMPKDINVAHTFKDYIEACKDGTVDKESLMYCRYERFFQRFLPESTYEFLGDLETKNVFIFGKPRTGKSRLVRDFARARGLRIYNKLANKWWDGYRDHEIVLLEDLDPPTAKMLVRHFKLWCDRYPFTAEFKGGSSTIEPKFYFIVTSNYRLSDCFDGVDLDAIAPRMYVWDFDN